ncbi:5'-3' DNA helicase ZGRF1 [Latimeria chalumnae]|uniref:5'-3' DNA helicase ZGRF1 n=1 Tax=Latimeria chalumnae TaxID=7897 RepID=UPI00313F03B5
MSPEGNKATLFDEQGQRLDCIYIKTLQGFQGPRQVQKKVATEDDCTSGSTLQANIPLPSRFYSMSPLFSTSYKKETVTSLVMPSSSGSSYLKNCDSEARGSTLISSLLPASASSDDSLSRSSVVAGTGAKQPIDFKPPLVSQATLKDPRSGSVVSQSIRSKAQVLALLKSSTTSQSPHWQASKNGPHQASISSVENLNVFSEQQCKVLCESTRPAQEQGLEHHWQQSPGTNAFLNSSTNSSHWEAYLPKAPSRQSFDKTIGMKSKIQSRADSLCVEVQESCEPDGPRIPITTAQSVDRLAKEKSQGLVAGNYDESENQVTKSLCHSSSHTNRWASYLMAPVTESEKHQHDSCISEPKTNQCGCTDGEGELMNVGEPAEEKNPSFNKRSLPMPHLKAEGGCLFFNNNSEMGPARGMDSSATDDKSGDGSCQPACMPAEGLESLAVAKEPDELEGDEFSFVSFNLLDNFVFSDAEEDLIEGDESASLAHLSASLCKQSKKGGAEAHEEEGHQNQLQTTQKKHFVQNTSSSGTLFKKTESCFLGSPDPKVRRTEDTLEVSSVSEADLSYPLSSLQNAHKDVSSLGQTVNGEGQAGSFGDYGLSGMECSEQEGQRELLQCSKDFDCTAEIAEVKEETENQAGSHLANLINVERGLSPPHSPSRYSCFREPMESEMGENMIGFSCDDLEGESEESKKTLHDSVFAGCADIIDLSYTGLKVDENLEAQDSAACVLWSNDHELSDQTSTSSAVTPNNSELSHTVCETSLEKNDIQMVEPLLETRPCYSQEESECDVHTAANSRIICSVSSKRTSLSDANCVTECTGLGDSKRSDVPGLGDDLFLLKSLSEHSTALESLEMLRLKKAGSLHDKDLGQVLSNPVQDIKGKALFEGTEGKALFQEIVNILDLFIDLVKLQVKDQQKTLITSLKGIKEMTNLENNRRIRPRKPVITLPSADEPSELTAVSEGNPSDQVEQWSPVPSLSLPACQIGPQDMEIKRHFSKETTEGSRQEPTRPSVSNLSIQSSESKWLKYQNTPLANLAAQNTTSVLEVDDFYAGNVFGKLGEERREPVMQKSAATSQSVQMIQERLVDQHGTFKRQDNVTGIQATSSEFRQPCTAYKAQNSLTKSSFCAVTGDTQNISVSELSFPSSSSLVRCASIPKRQVCIPASFISPGHYKQVFTAALTEHLNILLFDLSQKLHKALSKVDTSGYTSGKQRDTGKQENFVPFCQHKQPAKLVMVKKEGPNKGRFFYTCDASQTDRCNFFKWLEEVKSAAPSQAGELQSKMVLSDARSISAYIRSQHIPLYGESKLLVRKAFDFQRKPCRGKLKRYVSEDAEFADSCKTRLYLKLSRKEQSSAYNKDDVWVVSKTLSFDPLDAFIACSVFYGPSSSNEVEILPLKGYCASKWPSDMVVHALLVCNASSELTSMRNLQDFFSPNSLPVMPSLLKIYMCPCVYNFRPGESKNVGRLSKGKFVPPAFNSRAVARSGLLSLTRTLELAFEMIGKFCLNTGQAAALTQVAQMMAAGDSPLEPGQQQISPVTVVHGVFGAGKSYLLAVVVLFLVHLFEENEAVEGPRRKPWKLLVSSSTNVAVDRVLLGLLDLGFDKFIRVGSIRKISKPILPYSLHAGMGSESEELRELQSLLREDLTPVEKVYVRRSIEQHKLGSNKTLLGQVRVVGVTCAACPFPCMNKLKFPVVVLDECSQMTEPSSLLPIARFECEKLVLVGDPKQLSPTIQGSDGAHDSGLEQTLFDRLCLMGHQAVLLRTQYRCHPAISAIANDLFYEGRLLDGISEADRSPLLDWLPTLCFYSVKGVEQIERDGSFYNLQEATFTVKLIESLIASGTKGSMIGVITLYRSQMYKLCSLLAGAVHCDPAEVKAVQVSTVDAFQGAEKEIIVLSCVRTRQVGFIDSEKRMNVALTRGRRHLLIVGNLACLRKNKLWGKVIHHCEGRENGLKHASQSEQELDGILRAYLERRNEERNISNQKRKSRGKSLPLVQEVPDDSQSTPVPADPRIVDWC